MSMDWFPWYPIDYRRDTLRLTLAEDGAYRRLIDEYMMRREALPDDDVVIARILGTGLPDWLNVSRAVRRYFKAKDGLLFHKRCDQELRSQDTRSERHRESGRKGAFKRYSQINNIASHAKHQPSTLHYISPLSLTSTEQGAEKGPSKKKEISQMPAGELVALRGKHEPVR